MTMKLLLLLSLALGCLRLANVEEDNHLVENYEEILYNMGYVSSYQYHKKVSSNLLMDSLYGDLPPSATDGGDNSQQDGNQASGLAITKSKPLFKPVGLKPRKGPQQKALLPSSLAFRPRQTVPQTVGMRKPSSFF